MCLNLLRCDAMQPNLCPDYCKKYIESVGQTVHNDAL